MTLRRTALFDAHKTLGARLVDFHGWELPIQYAGILKEHDAVRTACGIFDVSHMGRLEVSGPGALTLLQTTNTNDILRLKPGQALYSHMLNERGGLIDDLIIGRLAEDRYFVVVNAATREGDIAWIKHYAGDGVKILDLSDATSMIALQGPKAEALATTFSPKAAQLPRFGIMDETILGQKGVISRTGYTGEDGFEFVVPNAAAQKLWDELLKRGKEFDIAPCGLGARDTLRLEAGYLLNGQDADEDHSSLEAGYGWVVKFDKGDFIGKKSLELQKKEGLKRKMTGVILEEAGVPRPGAEVFYTGRFPTESGSGTSSSYPSVGRKIGTLASATFSPTLKAGIGMGYLDNPNLKAGEPLEVDIRGRKVKARVAAIPFYQRKNAKT